VVPTLGLSFPSNVTTCLELWFPWNLLAFAGFPKALCGELVCVYIALSGATAGPA